MLITKSALLETSKKIQPFIHNTPVLTSRFLNTLTESELFFKCENFQKTGSFKIRGATNAILNLTVEQKQTGVATHSSGNFAQALALAATQNTIQSHIVMPSNSAQIKKDAVKGYGGLITECEPTLEARESILNNIVKQTEATFIHPFNDIHVIAGQATCCMELLNQVQTLEYIVVPVGGGGLSSGTALAAHFFGKQVQVIGAEPSGADDAYKSKKEGKIIPNSNSNTIADGLRTSLGDLTFPIIRDHISEIITISDSQIIDAMRLVWERMKLIIEPSSATVLAAVLKSPDKFRGKRIGLIISGGNVDVGNMF